MTLLHRPGQQKSRLVQGAREDIVRTKNGAVTHPSTLNKVLDMFFLAGASRTMSDRDIINLFVKAFGEDEDLALKCLFYARDIRGGMGERRFFRLCWKYLLTMYYYKVEHLVKHVPEYGRWDDIFFDEDVAKCAIEEIKTGLKLEQNALLAKWLPRKGEVARLIRTELGYTPKQYRKTIVGLSSTVEQKMCKNKWKDIDYPHVPSVAMNKYRKAFFRNDEARFNTYIDKVTKGTEKINANAIFPHTLVQSLYAGGDKKAIEAQWNNLPNLMEGSTDRILPVCDTSGSMIGLPMDVSISLGVYISERNEGIFKNAFITFSSKPRMHYLEGTLFDRLMGVINAPAGYSTNLIGVFSLLLNTAVRNELSETEMPTKILVISDMEFDGTGGGYYQRRASQEYETNYETIKSSYRKAGYEMPALIFWNVNGRQKNAPATKNDKVGLVSGFSPNILSSILKDRITTPLQLMIDTIGTKRYKQIVSK